MSMKQHGSAFAVAALVVGLAPLSAHAQSANLIENESVDSYITNIYVTSAAQVSGSSCSFSTAEHSSLQLEITNSGQTVTFIGANPDDSSGQNISFFLFLPPLPGGLSTGQSTSWTGNYEKLVLPGGTESGALTFSGSIQLTGKGTFVGTMAFSDMPSSGNSSCNVSMQFSSVFSGAALLTQR